MKKITYILICIICTINLVAKDTKNQSFFEKNFKDEKDGQFDASNWLASRIGFLPVPVIITGPTLGAGGALNLMFLHDSLVGRKTKTGRSIPPTLSGIVAGGTENGSKFAAAYNMGFWKEDTIRTKTFIGRPNFNLDYYPSVAGHEKETEMNLKGLGLYEEVTFRAGESNFFPGFNVMYMNIDASPENPASFIPDNLRTKNIKVSALSAVLEYDTRDSIFTPNKGTYFKASAMGFNEFMGGDYEFQKYNFRIYNFTELEKNLVLGLRFDGSNIEGQAPFFFYPSIDLRGIATARYQGKSVTTVEGELRWDVTPRWSLVGFLGTGKAFGDTVVKPNNSFSNADFESTQGIGLRYTIARKFKLKGGFDVAFGPNGDPNFYITVGTAWGTFF